MKRIILMLVSIVVLSMSVNSQTKLLKDRYKYPLESHENEGFLEPERKTQPKIFLSESFFPTYKVNQLVTSQPQNEPSVRINRKNKNNIVAAYRDFRLGSNPAIRNIGIAASSNGGATWTEQLAAFRYLDLHSDPAVGVDTAGNFFIVTLDYSSSNGTTRNALSVRRSTDGGFTWPYVVAAAETMFNVFHDREIIAVDDGTESPNSGNVYVSWTEFGGTGGIHCASSVDNGFNFSSVQIPGSGGQGSMPITGPDGELYVVWTDFGSPNHVMISLSTDAGTTFGSDHIVSDDAFQPTQFINVNGGIESFGYPVASVDKTHIASRGTVYVTWQTLANGDVDVYCAKSTDRGASWSQPVRVNDDTLANGRDQFHQWATVDDSGWVDVVFLDRRHDPNNILADAYLARSRDGGLTFKNYRLSTQNFDPTLNYNGDVRIGDYMGIDQSQGRLIPVFTDTHLGNQDIFISNIDHSQSAAITGYVYNDKNGDSVREGSDAGLAGWRVFMAYDSRVDSAVTDSTGAYAFTGLFAGTYILSVQAQTPWLTTAPPLGVATITIDSTEAKPETNFGFAYPGNLRVASGWNMVSLPESVADGTASTIFSGALSKAYHYQNSYVAEDTLQFGQGYWLKFTAPHFVTIEGDSITHDSIAVHAGWNMIGSLTVPVLAGSITPSPGVSIRSFFYGYNGVMYNAADTLFPGNGYWVKVSGDGKLAMNGTGAFVAQARKLNTARLNTLTISDAGHRSGILCFGMGTDNGNVLAASELPPKPPAGTFDVRFGSQRQIELLSPVKRTETILPVEIQSAETNIHIAWNIVDAGIHYVLADSRTGNAIPGVVVAGKGEADVPNIPLQLRAVPDRVTSVIPTDFALEQNYPNPFNPSTIITYSLPKESFVKLRIYNVLGQEVKTLVNDWQVPAKYKVLLDAASLPSGIYYYTLETNEFKSSRKMAVVK